MAVSPDGGRRVSCRSEAAPMPVGRAIGDVGANTPSSSPPAVVRTFATATPAARDGCPPCAHTPSLPLTAWQPGDTVVLRYFPGGQPRGALPTRAPARRRASLRRARLRAPVVRRRRPGAGMLLAAVAVGESAPRAALQDRPARRQVATAVPR